MGAIRRVKSAARPLAFGSDGVAIGFCGGLRTVSAGGSANAGRSCLPPPRSRWPIQAAQNPFGSCDPHPSCKRRSVFSACRRVLRLPAELLQFFIENLDRLQARKKFFNIVKFFSWHSAPIGSVRFGEAGGAGGESGLALMISSTPLSSYSPISALNSPPHQASKSLKCRLGNKKKFATSGQPFRKCCRLWGNDGLFAQPGQRFGNHHILALPSRFAGSFILRHMAAK